MGIEAGEKYCSGEISWEEALKTDWYSEASAFLFDYNDEGDPNVASYVELISQDRDNLERLLVPPNSFGEQSVRELLRDAAYFANFSLKYPGMRLGRNSKRFLADHGKFMPLELFDVVVPGIVS